ncbi:unnamed protein product [Symbiodinium sp. CCMP2592]|nr:unnamed protein product [Symbiodinium sp. CCMP2592]
MQMALSTDEATWPYEVDDGDHFETSAEAYHDILPLLRCAAKLRGLSAEDLKIYDPYYCSGRAKRLLQELGFHRVAHRRRDFYADIAAGKIPSFHVLVTNPPYSADHKNRLLDFLLERQRAAKAEALSEPFLLLLPSWTAGKAFFRKFLRALARLGEAPTSGRGREERGAGVFYVCRRGAEGKPEKYSFDHVAGAGRLTCPFFGIWICGGFGEAAATNRALKAAASGRAEGLWEGAWHSCRPLPPDNEEEDATTSVRWLEDETWSELPNQHLRGGDSVKTDNKQPVCYSSVTGARWRLGLSRIKMVTARGTVLGGAATLQEAGIEDGEVLAVVVKDIEIVGTYDGRAFAMIGRDGSVVTWGQDSLGGDSIEVQHQLRNVQQIKGTRGAFAAILEDGSVCTWGETRQDATFEAVRHELRDVRNLQASFGAFAAVRGDGTVVAWGSHSHGGRITGALKTKLQFVRDIEATGLAFAALCADGSVVAWGHEDSGGDSRAVGDRLQQVWKAKPQKSSEKGNLTLDYWGWSSVSL